MLMRAHVGTVHKISPKHLKCYVQEFAGKRNVRKSDTIGQMLDTVSRLIGRNLLYTDLTSDNGLDSGAQRARAGRGSVRAAARRSPASRAWRPRDRAADRSSVSFLTPILEPEQITRDGAEESDRSITMRLPTERQQDTERYHQGSTAARKLYGPKPLFIRQNVAIATTLPSNTVA